MGSVCAPEQRSFHKLEEYAHPDNIFFSYKRAEPKTSRFGNIQRIRTRKNDVFKLIMATNDAKMQTVSIECRILESTASFELYDGTKFDLLDRSVSPLIDLFDPSESQIYHPIRTMGKYILTLKAYPFKDYGDNVFKRAIYQIWLYGELRSMSPLVDFFIMSRGKANTMVMIFKNFEVSLLEIVQYRKLAKNYYWSEAQLVTLWKVLISNYKTLKNLSICHRDIRLGKIYFTSDNKNHPFQFANLSTARKITRTEADANDLLTVVGVSLFAESPMRQKIQKGEQVGMYDPLAYDSECLVRVLLSLLNLDPHENKPLACKNQRLAPIIQKLKQNPPDIQQAQKDLEAILLSLSYDKSVLFREDKIISEHLSKSQLRRINRSRIEQTYFDVLLRTHNKEAFNKILLDRIQQNEMNNQRFESTLLLNRVGAYYAKIGLQRNQYFQEEFSLLLQLAKQSREEEFLLDHQQYLGLLAKLLDKIPNQSHELPIIYGNEVAHRMIYEGKDEAATSKYLANLFQQTCVYNNIRINVQLDILITKTLLEIKNSKFEITENTIDKFAKIVSTSTFESQYEAKRYQAAIYYLRGFNEVQMMSSNRQDVKPIRLTVAEGSLTSALNILTNLPESNSNIIAIVHAYLAKADFYILKEDYPKCSRCLENADMLLSELEKGKEVSDGLKLKVFQRLKSFYQKSNRAGEPAYNEILSKLSKIVQRSQESNASRHQRSKELRQRQRLRNRHNQFIANFQSIQEGNEEDQGRD